MTAPTTPAAPAIPFVAALRTGFILRIGAIDGQAITVRVEVPEAWDVVRVDAPAETTVEDVKLAALLHLVPRADPSQYVIKLRGFEVLDERLSLRDAGAVNGSIFLLTNRRRRPVR